MVAWILQSNFYIRTLRWLHHNIYPALFAIFVIGPIVWAASDRQLPFRLTDGFTVPQKIIIGKEFHIEWRYENLPRRCPGVVYLYMVYSNGRIWVAPPATAAFGLIQTGGANFSGKFISGHKRVVPSDAVKGPAAIFLTVDFRCNWTQYFWPLYENYGPIMTEIVD